MNINGKEVHTRYGMLATDYFLSKAGLISSLSHCSTIGLAHILWGGIMNFYEVKQLPYPVTFEEVYDFVEAAQMSNDKAAIEAEIALFESSQALQKRTEQVKEAVAEIEKKRIAQTTESDLPTKQD